MKTKKTFTSEEIQKAFTGIQKLRENIETSNALWLLIAEKFHEAREEKWFQKNKLKRRDFLGEMSLSPQTINNWEKVYKTFCVVGKCSIVELSKRSDILIRLIALRKKLFKPRRRMLPELMVSQEIFQDWIGKAIHLSTTDFWIEFEQTFTLKNIPDEHRHEYEEIIKKKWKCKVCGEIIFANPLEEHSH